jgi:hypothetical protein
MSFTDLEIPTKLLWKRLSEEGVDGPSNWKEYEIEGAQKNDAGGDWDGSGETPCCLSVLTPLLTQANM